MERAPRTRRTTLRRQKRFVRGGHGGKRARSFWGEQLESRIALSADSINLSIFGSIYSDFDGDGAPGVDEALANVGVQLFRDNGDRQFTPAADSLEASTTTDNSGVYQFEDLDPDAAYFVVRFGQTVGDRTLGEVISPVIQPGRPGLIIDLFQTRQILAVDPPPVSSDGNTRTFPAENEVIGGERDLYAELISGVGDVTFSVNPYGIEELLEFNNAPATIGNRLITWDGLDNDSDKLSLGLGGRDLTNDGAYQGIVLRGGVDESGAQTTFEMRIYQGSPDNFSRMPFRLPVTGGDASGYIFLPFADFKGNVSATNVDAIQLLIEGGAAGTDGKLALIGALGPTRFDIGEVDQADLSIHKSNSVDALLPGDMTTYVITVVNQGPARVQGAHVVDTFTGELFDVNYFSQVSGQVSGHTESGTGHINDVVDMAVGSSITYVVQAKVSETAVSPIVNVAEVSVPSEILDPDVTNNSSTDGDPIGVETDLQITKDDGRREVRVGDTITYRIDARNNGSVDIRDIRVTDLFPSQLDDVTFVSQGSPGTSGNTPSGTSDIDDLVDIPSGGVIRYTVTATVSDRAVGTLVNRAFIEPPAGYVDVNLTDNVEIDVNLVQRELVDISVSKSNGTDQLVPGQSVTYSIVVRNDGPSNAARVNVVDDFPEQLLDVTYTSQSMGGASNASEQGRGNIDDVVDLPADSSIIYLATGTVAPNAFGTIENTASVTVFNNDVNPENNRATDVDLLIREIDLAIIKSDQNSTVRPGDQVTYEVVVTNHGPSDVVGVRVTDVVPSGLVDVTYARTLSGEVVTGEGDLDDTIDLVAGESARYAITANVSTAAEDSLVNTATVLAPPDVVEVQLDNNTATDTNQVVRGFVDVSVRKFSDPSVAVPGRELHYTIVVANIGQSAVDAAQVQDVLPVSLENVRYTSEATGDVSGHTSGDGNIDDVLQMAPGAAVMYSVTGTLVADATGSVQNMVRVDTIGQVDSNPANNIDVAVIGVRPEAELAITKSDGRSDIDIGDRLVYEIVVQNHGPSDVTKVSIIDEVPVGYEDVTFTATATGGAAGYSPAGMGSLDEIVDLPVGSTITYRMEGFVTQAVAGTLTNVARVRGPLEDGFIEIDPANNVATDVDVVSSMVVLGSEPTIIRPRQSVEVGTRNRYQITAHETGRMIVTAHFSHMFGDLQLAIFDNRGNSVAFVDSETDDERLVIPVVSQETYVIAVSAADDEITNLYDLEIENFKTFVPDVLRLTAATDSGMMADDGVTNAVEPMVIIQADVVEFLQAGIPLLVPWDADGDIPREAGVAVGAIVTNVATGESIRGFAMPVGASTTLFSYAADGLLDGEYTVSAFVQVQDGAQRQELAMSTIGRSTLSRPYWLTIDRTPPQAADRPRLLDSSDSGVSFDDQVTNVDQPALMGIGEPNVKVRVTTNRVRGQLEVVGQSMTNPDGSWEITVEPLDDDWYHFRPEFEDLAGNVSSIAEPLVVEVDTLAPNTPFLDLVRFSDTGISDSDNVTSLSELTFSMTTDDFGVHLIPFNYKFRLFLRPDAESGFGAGQEVLIYDSSLDPDVPVENLLDGFTDLSQLTRTLGPFPDGVHNFKLEVEDRAGNVSYDFLLDVTIDTVSPLSTVELSAVSESGTYSDDGVINKAVPTFDGVSEVGTRVELFANGRLVGTSVVGSDGSDRQLGDGRGVWEISSESLVDGSYSLTSRFEDLAGNQAMGESLDVWIDTVAPNIPQLQPLMEATLNGWITNRSTPEISITASDTNNGGVNLFPNDLRFRVFDRPGNEQGEVLVVDSFGALRELTSGGFFLETLPALSDGVHNLKVEVEDRAGNLSSAFLIDVEVDTQNPSLGDPEIDLAEYADSGMSSSDHVTHIRRPAILGRATPGSAVIVYANGEIAGTGIVNSDDSDGKPSDGLGAWEITVEPLADDVYELVARVHDIAGNSVTTKPLTIEIDSLPPNLPFLDLAEDFDTGRHNDDNVTNSRQLLFQATTSDPNADNHLQLIPGGQNFAYRIFDRPEGGAETLVYDSSVDVSLPDLLDGLISATQILTNDLNLFEVSHNLTLEVEDRAGNTSREFVLEMLIDRTPFVGSARLHPDSDSGNAKEPHSFRDGITNDRSPKFTGFAEANSLVSITIDGVPAGTAVAIPLDGDDAVQPPSSPYNLDGTWTIDSVLVLDDGEHEVVVTYEDPAGNRATSGLENELVISTGGIQIINVTRVEPSFPSLFDPKPASGPDPLIPQVAIHLQSATGTELVLGDPANLTEEGHYVIVGDSNGPIPVARVDAEATNDGRVTVVLTFPEPLPDDRFTLTVSEKLSDRVGNRLDGESGANAPFEGTPGTSPLSPIFPTGDGERGGDFIARFTVDSRPEIGTWGAGSAWIDTNGNFDFDPQNHVDFVNRDIVYRYGFTSDDLFAGNFALSGEITDGYDKLGAYGIAEGEFRWLVDTDNDGVPNIDRIEPSAANGRPVVGRFDANSQNGDEVGVFDGTYWYFDTNHDFMTDTRLRSHLIGYPIVGDFDGDGFDDLATWADNRFMIDLAEGRLRGWDGFAEEVIGFGFSGVRERPVAADMDQDGFADLGLWVPDREGQLARASAEWYFLMSDGESLLERLSPADDPIDTFPVIDFRPIPFGPDVYVQFGDEFAEPIVGNFDPPTLLLEVERSLEPWTNPVDVLDVSGDRQISPFDALLIINELNVVGSHELGTRATEGPYFDVNMDGFVSPLDALLVLNELNRSNRVQLAGVAPAVSVSTSSAVSAMRLGGFSSRTRLLRDHVRLEGAEVLGLGDDDLSQPVDLGLMSPAVRAHDWDDLVHLIAMEQAANRSHNDDAEIQSSHALGSDRGI